MMLIRIFAGVFFAGAVSLPAFFSVAQTTTPPPAVDTSTGWTGGLQAVKDGSGLSSTKVETIVGGFMGWIIIMVGFLSIIAFLVAGIMYLTAAGNDSQIKTAKEAMKWSIVGVIVALVGYVVILAVDFWLTGSGGADTTL